MIDDRERRLGLLGGADQRLAVLWETRSAKARAGMQEFAADPAVEPDAAGDILNVGPHRLAQIGHLVDEGDLRGEEGVGRIFDQLGGFDRGEDDRRFEQVERPVKRAQDGAGMFAVGADHDAVGTHEIGDRRAFAQEFGVGRDIEAGRRQRLFQNAADPATGADRHGRFGDDHRPLVAVLLQCLADFGGGGEYIAEIRMAVAATRRRANRDEYRIGAGHRRFEVGREAQPPRRHVAGDQLVETGLVDRHLAARQPFDLSGILVDAGDGHPEFRKARSRDEADIPCPDHRNAHQYELP